MIPKKSNFVLLISLFVMSSFFSQPLTAKAPLLTKKDVDIEIDFWGIFRPEAFAGKNFTFLNNNNPEDVVFYFRHTNDVFASMVYGNEKFGYPVAEFRAGMRNRAIWGSPSTIALTLPSETNIAGVAQKPHLHAFPRLFFWLREIWLKTSLNDMLNLGFENQHTMTLGAFPFELGRGIALGSAYAAGPGPLGFFSDSAIDQYAFGIKLSGDIIENRLSYDIYGSLLQSRSCSLSETSKKVFEQEIGRRQCPARGFGSDNYLVAARLVWTPLKSDCWGMLSFEPYIMYNNDPEQRIEFAADASSKLGTFGLATEYIGSQFELGFDVAKNMGAQFVRAWDRNHSTPENRGGDFIAVNSQVSVQNSPDAAQNNLKAPFAPKTQGQTLINESADTGSEEQNGKVIDGVTLGSMGFVPGPLQLVNSNRRFREAYKNTYNGFMVVGDAAYWFMCRQLMFAVTAGIASGDEDPNMEVKDGTFDGFIGLQEVYSGKRVKSVFLLGTVGKARRPGTTPENPLSPRDFALSDSGFTNLVFFGSGVTWKPKSSPRRLLVNPNIFAYWKDQPGPKFCARTGKDLPEKSSPFLGVELNLFISCFPLSNLKFFTIGSVFFPGSHFKDIKGRYTNAEEKQKLVTWQKSGLDGDRIPNNGNDTGYTVNVGLEFAF